jgi:formylmethanofuran dehydrogenase subunit D
MHTQEEIIYKKIKGVDKLTNVNKKNGSSEMFDRTKLERSIRYAGADEKMARAIAAKVKEREGMTTDDIRRTVADELSIRNTEVTARYEDTKRFAAKKAMDAAKGTARITENCMKKLNLKSGDTIELMHENRRHTVRTEKASVGRIEIHLHEEDLNALGAKEGTRIAVRRQK